PHRSPRSEGGRRLAESVPGDHFHMHFAVGDNYHRRPARAGPARLWTDKSQANYRGGIDSRYITLPSPGRYSPDQGNRQRPGQPEGTGVEDVDPRRYFSSCPAIISGSFAGFRAPDNLSTPCWLEV